MNQFYHHFSNKAGLIHEVLQTYYDVIKDADGRSTSSTTKYLLGET
jgi:AcrR family transcriptional regulator